MSPNPQEWPRHLRDRHEWKQYDYLNLDWPKTYFSNPYTMNEDKCEINSLREYMKRARAQHPLRVFKVIKDGYGHEIKWRWADE